MQIWFTGSAIILADSDRPVERREISFQGDFSEDFSTVPANIRKIAAMINFLVKKVTELAFRLWKIEGIFNPSFKNVKIREKRGEKKEKIPFFLEFRICCKEKSAI